MTDTPDPAAIAASECCGWPELGGPCPDCPSQEILDWWAARQAQESIHRAVAAAIRERE